MAGLAGRLHQPGKGLGVYDDVTAAGPEQSDRESEAVGMRAGEMGSCRSFKRQKGEALTGKAAYPETGKSAEPCTLGNKYITPDFEESRYMLAEQKYPWVSVSSKGGSPTPRLACRNYPATESVHLHRGRVGADGRRDSTRSPSSQCKARRAQFCRRVTQGCRGMRTGGRPTLRGA